MLCILNIEKKRRVALLLIIFAGSYYLRLVCKGNEKINGEKELIEIEQYRIGLD